MQGVKVLSKRNIFLRKFCGKGGRAERIVPDLFLFLKRAQYEEKASGLQLSFVIVQ